MLDRLQSKVHIKVGPVHMLRMREFHVDQLSDGNIPKPGELLKRQEEFPFPEEKPESVFRNVGDFNF
jgi:hypothetical protein